LRRTSAISVSKAAAVSAIPRRIGQALRARRMAVHETSTEARKPLRASSCGASIARPATASDARIASRSLGAWSPS
jgi:hypothetical protein